DHRKKPSCHDFPCGHVKYPRSGRRPPVVGWRGWVRRDRRAVGGACRLPGCRAALIGGKAERKAHGGNGGSHTSAPCPASAPHTAPTIVRSVPGGVARILGAGRVVGRTPGRIPAHGEVERARGGAEQRAADPG